MKKSILILAAALTSMAASAFDLAPKHIANPLPPMMQSAEVELTPARMAAPKYASEETLSMEYSPAYEPYQAVGFRNVTVGSKYGQAFEFTKAVATTFAGNEITDVYFWTGVNTTSGLNEVRKATVFLAEDVDAEPFYTKEVELPTTRFTKVVVHLDQPYSIEAGKKVFVGFKCAIGQTTDYPVVVDYMYHGDDDTGGWIGIQPYGSDNMTWDNYADQVGFVTIGVVITGKNLPTDMVSIDNYYITPVAGTGAPVELALLYTNRAANEVNNIDLELQVGDAAAQTIKETLEYPIGYNEQAVVDLSGFTWPSATKELPVKVTITKVNGNDNKSDSKTLDTSTIVVDLDKSFKRNVVVEEFTGIWCGYCPMGIVAMEYLREHNENYSIIPVAVHYEDALSAASYAKVINDYCDGSVPSAVLNRWMDSYPETESLLEDIDEVSAIPAIASVTGSAKIDAAAKTITVDTKTMFSFDYTDGDENFILSYGITEDKVGPYEQHNYFSGSGELPGWDDKDEYVTTTYNDVARQLDRYSGIAGSVPAAIKAGEEYSFSHTIKASSTIGDLNNCNVIVYLTNVKTGVIENACWLTEANGYGGVSDICVDNADTDAPVEYYNLQGIRVAEPSNGLFIRRQGNTATKVLVK